MSIRRFPIVPAVVGVLVAGVLFALLPPRRVPLSLIGLFAGKDVERIDVLGGLAVEVEIDSEDPATIAETEAKIVDRLDTGGLGVAHSLTGNRGYLGLPEATEADLDSIRRSLATSGSLEFKIVHHDSELMARVAQEVMNAPPGPVEAQQDVWDHFDSGRAFRDHYLLSGDRAALEASLARIEPEPGHEFLIERVPTHFGEADSWRSYYVYSKVELSGADIESAEVVFNPTTNRAEVLISFDDDGARRFGELTAAHVGHKLAILLDGRISSAPVIQSAIRGGRSTITMGGTDPNEVQREAEALASALNIGDLPARVVVRRGIEVPSLVAPTSVFLARLTLALFAGLLMFAAALLVQRLIVARTPVAEAVAVRGGGAARARPWLRLAVTVAGPLLLVLGAKVLLPTLDERELLNLVATVGDGSDPDLTQFSVFALGLIPILSGFVLVEIVALAVPPWRPLRHDRAGRARLAVAALAVGVLVALLQGFFVAVWFEGLGRGGAGFAFGQVVAEPGAWFRAVTMTTLATGCIVLVVLAALLGRYGLGNGFSILMAGALIPEIRSTWQFMRSFDPTPVDLLALVGGAGAVVLATIWVCRARVRGVRMPAAGLVPMAWVTPVVLIITVLFWVGIDLPYGWLEILQPASVKGFAVYAVLVVGFGVACSWLFSRTGPTHPATVMSVGYLVVLIGIYYALIRFAPAAMFNIIAVVTATAVVLDLVAEWRARTRHGELALVHNEHRVQVVDSVLGALADAGIPAHPRGAAHRSLLHFFGPYVPISIYVPADRAAEADRVLKGV